MVPKPAHFKDVNDVHAEKLLEKVIEFKNLSIQIRITLIYKLIMILTKLWA